jgi:sulfate transport system permease protein
MVLLPIAAVVTRSFDDGWESFWSAATSPQAIAALKLTLIASAIVVAINAIAGTLIAWVLVRDEFPGKRIINSLIDLPFAVSPVVIGLALFLVYGKDGFIGGPLADAGIQIIFSTPGLVLATVFVSLPFVVREVMPVLQEIGDDQEQAATTLGSSSWQTFWKITLPSIRWGVTYGIVLATARSLGEFGAVAVVSGKISGQTETLPIFVESEYGTFNVEGAYAAAIVLAILAVLVLVSMNLLRRKPEVESFDPAGQIVQEKEA